LRRISARAPAEPGRAPARPVQARQDQRAGRSSKGCRRRCPWRSSRWHRG